MSDQIMQKLDEMLDIARSSSVPLGVSVARHNDLLLRDTKRALSAAVAALKEIANYASQHPCYCLEEDRPDPEGCYCSGNGHGPTSCADCLTHELHEIISKALGVES